MDLKNDSFDLQKVGQNIRKLRKIKKISQEDLSKKMGISRTSILRMEKGETDFSVSTLVSLSNALQVPVHSILDENSITIMNESDVKYLKEKISRLERNQKIIKELVNE